MFVCATKSEGTMIAALRRLACGGVVLASAIISIETSTAAVIIPDSLPFVRASESCNDALSVPHRCETPGTTDAFHFTNSSGFEENATADADSAGPNAAVQGETKRGSGPGSGLARAFAMAEVDWSAIVTPVGVGLVLSVSQVPVTFQATVEASVGGDTAGAVAEATSPFGSLLFCDSVGEGEEGLCEGITNSSGINTLTGFIQPNVLFELSVTAQGGAAEDSNFQASADPVLSIADELIPGTDINFRDAFTMAVSPDVTQSVSPISAPPITAQVPEPGTLRLLVVNIFIIFIVAIGRRGIFAPSRSAPERGRLRPASPR
jgi:hypothetical protein